MFKFENFVDFSITLTALIIVFVGIAISITMNVTIPKQARADQDKHQNISAEAIKNNEVIAEAVITEKLERISVDGLFTRTAYHYLFIVKKDNGNKTELEISKGLYINSDVGDTVVFYKGYDEAPRNCKMLYLEIRKVIEKD